MLHAPFGRALAGIRVNEQRMRSIGFPVFAYKLGAFVLAGALAGLAGYLAACQFGFVNPDILAWHQSGIVLMMVILGGMGRLHGAVIGAFSYVLLQEIFSAPALLGAYAKHWQLAMGGLIVMIVLVFPHGIGGFLDIALRRIAYRRFSRRSKERHMTSGEILKIRGLCKHFGGLAAVDNVSLEVRTGELHAVIGPNGAGKTTLVNLLSGDLPASSGSILFPRARHYESSAGAAFPSRDRPQLSKDQYLSRLHCAGKLPSRGAIARTAPAQLVARCVELWR